MVNQEEREKCKPSKWFCKCDCGGTTIAIVGNLNNGNTQSCGCLRRDRTIDTLKKYNTYNLSEKIGIGFTSKNEEFYFDLEDYEKIKDICWHVGGNGYIISSKTTTQNHRLYLHRIVTDCPNEMYVDHINGVITDNRKSNLRIVNKSQNAMNSKIYSNNSSGVTGVCWNSDISKWTSHIKINYKRIILGHFENKDDAILARKEAEQKYFGEFAYGGGISWE